MIRCLARAGAVLAAASLLLTACSGASGTPDTPAPTPTAHPVFGQKLDRQIFLAMRRTQQAGNAAFTQTITFVSKKGRAVQTLSGRLDFAQGMGAATAKWELSPGLSKDVRDTVLGLTPGKGNADASGSMLVDRWTIRYRAGSAAYWLEYRMGDAETWSVQDNINTLRGSEAPIGGTLLEGLGATQATSQRGEGPGRVYQARMPSSTAWDVFPEDLRRHLSAEQEGIMSYRESFPLPASVSVDGQGRVTHVRADFSKTLRHQDSAFKDMTSLTIDLRLAGHGTSRPGMKADGPVRAAHDAVRRVELVKRGGCIDFSTGQRSMPTVVDVPCTGPHDGRIFGQEKLGGRTYPGAKAARQRAGDACLTAYHRAPGRWTAESAVPGRIWSMWPTENAWNRDGGHATCYVITRRGTAVD
ncbi:hypothetical protein [Streptomyces sp. Ru71]|uniref:hypothetical protein n=1 Tax=Streptomyces sp. Ru71 TaxID=2080746 RepID=UPI0011B00EA9|nr:hypothetical protein [Streptomyces sp. Ru71]